MFIFLYKTSGHRSSVMVTGTDQTQLTTCPTSNQYVVFIKTVPSVQVIKFPPKLESSNYSTVKFLHETFKLLP